MKFLIDNWALISVALLSGGMLLWPVITRGGAGGLDPNAAVQLINREKAVVVDVCEPQEFAAGHVAGARNVPLSQLQARLPEVAKNKTVPLVLVCGTGTRAKGAAGIARGLGYEKAQVLAGGLRAWREANLPVEKA
ncbi:rhodanese-like domain-containing protein [Ramlibacter sp. MAHUQ-53]|uniref:rhodanese-like domain-containing protein n=1 Tax=unclassified Ramlibacter TaxID=2617605 RepID=UPI00363B75A6